MYISKQHSSSQTGCCFHLALNCCGSITIRTSDSVQHRCTSNTFASQHIPELPRFCCASCPPSPPFLPPNSCSTARTLRQGMNTHRNKPPSQLAAPLQHTTRAWSNMKQDHLLYTRAFHFLGEAEENVRNHIISLPS